MTKEGKPIGASPACQQGWDHLAWSHLKDEVNQLQMRIAKAAREGKKGKVKALQFILTRSFSGRTLAVKHVCSNKERKTPGVDNVLWISNQQKIEAVEDLKTRGYQPQPLRRIHIPKRGTQKIEEIFHSNDEG